MSSLDRACKKCAARMRIIERIPQVTSDCGLWVWLCAECGTIELKLVDRADWQDSHQPAPPNAKK
jgi:hypothetical protein